MDNVNATRINVYDSSNARSTSDVPTPKETLQRWKSELHHTPSRNLQEALADLAHGRRPEDVRRAFVELIDNGAFELFVEAFELNFAHETVHATQRGEPPPQRRLRLSQAPDWAPDVDAMKRAFSRLKIDELVVCNMWGTQNGVPHPLAPAATCEAVAFFLEQGLSKLSITGALASPDLVVHAFGGSSLTEIALCGVPKWCPWSCAEEESFNALIRGVKACKALKCLSLQDSRLFGQRDGFMQLLAPGGPQLERLNLSWELVFNRDDAIALMKVFRQIATLSSVRLHEHLESRLAGRMDVECLDAVFLQQLKDHPALSRVEFHEVNFMKPTASNMLLMQRVLELAVTCPSFRHFAWIGTTYESNPSPWALMSSFQQSGGDVVMSESAVAVAKLIKDPRLKLDSLQFQACALPSEPLVVVVDALAKRLPRLRLDVQKSCISAAVMPSLTRAIFQNPRLKPGFPMALDFYYLVSGDGRIWGISRASTGAGFTFISENPVDEAERDGVRATLSNYLEEIDRFLAVLNRNEMLEKTAPLLEKTVLQFLTDASGSGYAGGSWIERDMVQTLARDQRLPTLVQLASVNKAARETYAEAVGGADLKDLKALVAMETEVHESLMDAAGDKNGHRVRQLLKDGAEDVGGHAFKRARDLVARGVGSPDVVAAFREFEPRFQKSVATATSTPTTTTTTSTTVTTTTTTTSTSTTSATTSMTAPSTRGGGKRRQ